MGGSGGGRTRTHGHKLAGSRLRPPHQRRRLVKQLHGVPGNECRDEEQHGVSRRGAASNRRRCGALLASAGPIRDSRVARRHSGPTK